MHIKRIWVMFKARNFEFFRDKASFGWNFLFPFLLVAGFGILFGGREYVEYKIGVFPAPTGALTAADLEIPEGLRNTRFVQFVGFASRDEALIKLRHHKIDFVIQAGPAPHQYWISDSSHKGYLVEKIFQASLMPPQMQPAARKGQVPSAPIRYIDWLFPGILAMNMMFSALWGVGYVVVRYRKNGTLRRLKATPLTALEYLTAQMLSRLFLLMFTLAVVWFGCDLIFEFNVAGSLADIFLMFFLGSLSLAALGLVLAARGVSEEFTTGTLNFISWPMMFLSEVWFSLEGAPQWVKQMSQIFPLTQLLQGVRKITNDGATLAGVLPEIGLLVAMTIFFLAAGAYLFSWD
ncbi:MAG: ABC transporter permease [Desulfobacterales bacterium]|nr:ABC transporter permease [Desulfobacterales bacterium]